MKRFLLLAAAAILPACAPEPELVSPAITLADCRLRGVEGAAKCGTYEVWEDRAAKSGRRIRLDIAVLPAARTRGRLPDPVMILAGGPGQGAVALASQVKPIFARLNDARDIVLVDQRGTGNSHPLDCDEDDDSTLQSLFEDALPMRLVLKCLAKLDADPRLYLTSIAVEDLDEVRGALGYETLNLWGGSYGTRVGLEYLRRHPGRVRTLTLDGVAPATMKLPLSFVADGEAAFDRLVEACGSDAHCNRTYPHLRETTEAMRRSLSRRPVRAAIQDPRTGDRETVNVNENVFLSGLFRPLYVAELASLLPYGITAAAEGDFNPLLAQNLEVADDIAENLSLGVHLSVICSEDVPRITAADLASVSRSLFGRALVDDFVRACRLWPHGSVPDDFYQPVRADAPVLILSGGIDPATPPRHGELVAADLPNSRHLVAPQLGHGVSSRGCAPRLIESFIRRGDAKSLDGKCLERIPRPMFVLPLGTRP